MYALREPMEARRARLRSCRQFKGHEKPALRRTAKEESHQEITNKICNRIKRCITLHRDFFCGFAPPIHPSVRGDLLT